MMLKEELVQKSALRLLEQSSHGGLKQGELGMFISRHGVGKTACLVHIAIDELLQNKQVIHVSFSDRPDHIIDWYENSFKTLAEEKHLDDAMKIHDEIVQNRVLMHFAKNSVRAERVISTLSAIILDGQFSADLIIFDGYDFNDGDTSFIQNLRKFVLEQGMSAWFSATIHNHGTEQTGEGGIPQMLSSFEPHFDVIFSLLPQNDHILLALLKDREHKKLEKLSLELDSKTLLIRAAQS